VTDSAASSSAAERRGRGPAVGSIGRALYKVAWGGAEGIIEELDGRPARVSIAEVDEGPNPRSELSADGPRAVHGACKCVISRRQSSEIRLVALVYVRGITWRRLGLPIQIL